MVNQRMKTLNFKTINLEYSEELGITQLIVDDTEDIVHLELTDEELDILVAEVLNYSYYLHHREDRKTYEQS
jgi:hypothetical protein